MVWYLSTAAVVSYMIVRGLLILRAKRGYRDFENSKFRHYFDIGHHIHPSISQSRQVRYVMWIPLHGMEFALLPLLPHGSSAVPSPLLPRSLLRHPSLMCFLRSRHVHSATSNSTSDHCCAPDYRYLELRISQPSRIWKRMDKIKVSQLEVVEDLGLLLVRYTSLCSMFSSLIYSPL